MSLRLEQNWKWSSQTFLHTLCAVKPWYETTCCGICLVSDANLHWAPVGGGEFRPKNAIFFPFFTIKLDFCYLNFSKNIKLFKNLLASQQGITFRLHKTCITFSLSPPLTAPGDCHWKGGETFLDKAEITTCLIKIFSNWYSDLYQKWQYIGIHIFHPLQIFWCLKLHGQSISFSMASHLHATPMRNLHFCVIFVHRYRFSKWHHFTSFKLDLLFVSY